PTHQLPKLVSLCFGLSRKRGLPEPCQQGAKDTQYPRRHRRVENRASSPYQRFLQGLLGLCNDEIIPVGIHDTPLVARAAADFVYEVAKLPLEMVAQFRFGVVFWMVLEIGVKRGKITSCRRVLACQPDGPQIRVRRLEWAAIEVWHHGLGILGAVQ